MLSTKLSMCLLTLLIIQVLIIPVISWTTISLNPTRITTFQQQQQMQLKIKNYNYLSIGTTTKSSTLLLYAGFGITNKKDDSNKKNKDSSTTSGGGGIKLKPKQQWDRYMIDLKKMKRFIVGVRVMATTTTVTTDPATDESSTTNTNTNEWIIVGSIKSIDDKYTDFAIARQRALIADHARRLYPTKVSVKDRLEWGYCIEESTNNNNNNENEETTTSTATWTVIDKSVADTNKPDNLPVDIDKLIGFEGTPDPATGYYCVYNEGRIINTSDLLSTNKKAGFTSKRQS